MTPEDVRKDTKKALLAMRGAVNEWAVRDTLCKLTEFGFWKGGSFVSLDEDTTRQVVDAALITIEDGIYHVVSDIYNVVYHFAKGD